MKKSLILLCITLLLATSLFVFCSCSDDEIGYAKADGIRLVDGSGNPLAIRGTNLGNWLVQEEWQSVSKQSGDWPTEKMDQMSMMQVLYKRFGKTQAESLIKIYEDNWITEKDFKNISNLGLNCVRIPFTFMNFYRFLDDQGNQLDVTDYTLKDNCWNKIDWALKMCEKYNLYAILDMHGAVGSQSGQDHTGDTTQHSLYNQDAHGESCRAKTQELWVAIAKRYKESKAILAYDLLNEPGVWVNGSQTTNTKVFTVYDSLYKAIRKVDQNHMISMESCWEASNLPALSKYGWDNVIYQFHHYNWAANNTKNSVYYLLKVRTIDSERRDYPVLIGEFNAWGDSQLGSNYSQTDKDALSGVLELYNGKGWNWTTWTYKIWNDAGSSWTWGLYSNDEEHTDAAYPNTMSFDEIAEIWKHTNTTYCHANTETTEIVKKYAKAAFRTTNSLDSKTNYAILS